MKLKIVQNKAIKASLLPGTTRESTKAIRELYQMIFKMVTNLNEIFGFAYLPVVLNCFCHIFTDLNWAYHYLKYQPLANRIGREKTI